MRHPRRNEVYRDVGSDRHEADDPDFIDLHEIPFEPDAALLICSDGLTDLIDSSSIQQIVGRHAGDPHQVVKALIDAANRAGGKDNVSAVFVEGPQFASSPTPADDTVRRSGPWQRIVRMAIIVLLATIIVAALFRMQPYWPLVQGREIGLPLSGERTIVVTAAGSIGAALQRAEPGSLILVEPGEYRETLTLRNGVRVVSRISRGATIRLPGTASEGDPAVVAADITGAELIGFRIVGDAATPLGTGVFVRHANLSIVDIEVSGAVNEAIAIDDIAGASVLASDIHDNPGAALAIRAGSPRIAHNVFTRNGMSERVQGSVIVDEGASPRFSGNVFHGIGRETFGHLGEAVRATLAHDNWFPDSQDARTTPPGSGRGQRNR
jgi:hypothetical protein